jgi:hypothetical protein
MLKNNKTKTPPSRKKGDQGDLQEIVKKLKLPRLVKLDCVGGPGAKIGFEIVSNSHPAER